jgi:hypothetical protein
MARPRLQIDEKQLFALARIQCTLPEIAAVLGCSTRTLRGRFLPLIKKGRQEGKASIRRIQYKLATEGNPTMAIWLGKQLLGQTDRHDHTSGGRSFEFTLNIGGGHPLPGHANGNGNGAPPQTAARFTSGN